MHPSLEQLGITGSQGFDGRKFTASIQNLLWEDHLDQARALTDAVVADGLAGDDHYRISNARNLTRNVSDYITRVERLRESAPADFDVLSLRVSDRGVDGGLPSQLAPTSEPKHFATYASSIPVTDANILTYEMSDERRSRFVAAGFANSINPTPELESIWVEQNCRVSAADADAHTVTTGDGRYVPQRSGRLAKVSRLNVFAKPKRAVTEALVLPFSHSPANYYHSLIEMAYGLRHVQRTSDRCWIIYGEDRFGVIPPIVEALGINPQRLVPAAAAADRLLETAYLPSINPFTWSSNLTSFFRRVALRAGASSHQRVDKFYISRQRSTRSPEYELELQAWLADRGFAIVYAEDLSVLEQIRLFANASCIVAHHGAGLANLAFCRDDVRVVEIFPGSILAPDFYQRTRFVTGRYAPVLGIAETVIGDVAAAL